MSRHVLLAFVCAMVLAVVASPSWAKKDSNALKTTIHLLSTTTITNTTLAPGDYNVVEEANQAKFEKDGKVVAEVPCTLKPLSSKAQQSEFYLNNNRLTEIQISGKTEAIDFPANQHAGD